jgi:PAS domain S-box-containing protein
MADMRIPKKGFYKEEISGATSITTPTEPTVSIPRPIDLIERVAKGDGEIAESKEAVEALRRSEQRLRDVIDTIPTMAWTALPDGSVDFVSRSWLEYTGFSMEDCLDGGWSTVAHPEDLDRTAQKWQAALVTGEPYECEVRTRTASGSYRWCLSRAVPLRDEVGKIVKWYGTNTDIDERKKAEEKLQESEAYLAEAQRLSQTGSFGCRLSTGEMFWSEETFRIYGYDRSTQPAVERVLQRVHPEDKPLVQEHMDRASREGKACDVECRLLLPDDSVKHVRIVAHAAKNESGIIEFIGAVMDVTATKQAEEKLRRSEAYLAGAQKLSHTGSFGWNVSSGEIYWSRETFRIFEYEPTVKVTIDLVVQRTHPEDRSAVQQLIERVSREKMEFDFEHRLLMPDGSVKHIHVLARALETSPATSNMWAL